MDMFLYIAGIAGVSGVGIAAAAIGISWKVLKTVNKRTEWKWDDKLVDTVEGVCEHLGVSPDDAANKGIGVLKRKIISPQEPIKVLKKLKE